MESKKFDLWLTQSAKLAERSAGDVVSRTKRAGKLVNLDSKMKTVDLLHALSKHPEFQNFTITVRSQVKRAVKLYRLYKRYS